MKCFRLFRTHRESSSLVRSCSRQGNCVVLATLFGIWIIAFLTWSVGCTVQGFRNVPDGQPTTPGQLRSAAAVARAEAQALDAIADQQEGVIRDVFQAVQQGAEAIGSPAVLTGLLGAAGGFLVPSPGQRRREKLAAAEAKVTTPPGS